MNTCLVFLLQALVTWQSTFVHLTCRFLGQQQGYGVYQFTHFAQNICWRLQSAMCVCIICASSYDMRHSTKKHRRSALKTSKVPLCAQNSLCSLGSSTTPALLSTCHFLQIKSSWLKSAKTDLFCSFPGACKWRIHWSLSNSRSRCAVITLHCCDCCRALTQALCECYLCWKPRQCFSFRISGPVLARGFRWALELVMSI